MRYAPMSVREQCNVEADMLDHFRLLPPEWKGVTSASIGKHSKRFPKDAYNALSISQAFFDLANTDNAPIDCQEMELAIRYKLGYGWWAWFFFRHFAVPIIKWLWNRYHFSSPEKPTGWSTSKHDIATQHLKQDI